MSSTQHHHSTLQVQIFSMIADELSDPARDCKKFDQSKRARELFNALDDDGNGFLTEDEFVSGTGASQDLK